MADDRAIRQGGDGRLEVEDLGDRHRDDRAVGEKAAELIDGGRVGAFRQSHVDGRADLEDVATVEGCGCFDVDDSVEVAADGLLGAVYLRLADVGAGTGDHCEIAEDDDGVLHEDGVGTIVGRVDMVHFPTVLFEGGHVSVPLLQRRRVVHLGALQVGEQALGKQWAGATDEHGGHEARAYQLPRDAPWTGAARRRGPHALDPP